MDHAKSRPIRMREFCNLLWPPVAVWRQRRVERKAFETKQVSSRLLTGDQEDAERDEVQDGRQI